MTDGFVDKYFYPGESGCALFVVEDEGPPLFRWPLRRELRGIRGINYLTDFWESIHLRYPDAGHQLISLDFVSRGDWPSQTRERPLDPRLAGMSHHLLQQVLDFSLGPHAYDPKAFYLERHGLRVGINGNSRSAWYENAKRLTVVTSLPVADRVAQLYRDTAHEPGRVSCIEEVIADHLERSGICVAAAALPWAPGRAA